MTAIVLLLATAYVIMVTSAMDLFVQVCAHACECTMHSYFTNCLLLPIDDDECKNGLHKCDINANCTNTIGSFECTCKNGFFGDGKICISKFLILSIFLAIIQ